MILAASVAGWACVILLVVLAVAWFIMFAKGEPPGSGPTKPYGWPPWR